MTKKNKSFDYGFAMVFSSLLINLLMILLVLSRNLIDYSLVVIISLCYSIISIILFSGFKLVGKKKSVTLILSLFYLRMVIIPFLIIIFGMSNTMNVNAFFNHSVETIFIMSYEYLCILLIIIMNNKKMINMDSKNDLEPTINKSKYNLSFLYLVAFLLGLFIIYILLKYPYAKTSIKFLFDSSTVNDNINNYNNSILFKDSINSILYWLYNLAFQILYILMPFIIIHNISQSKMKEKNKIIISFIIICIIGCLTTEEKAISIFVTITALFYMIELYPEYKKRIVKYIFAVFMAAFIGIFLKNGIGHSDIDFVEIIQAYFSGPYYINIAFNIDKTFNFDKIIPDILASLAYIKYFFSNVITSNDIYNIAYYGNDIRMDKIMPMIAQSYYYFGLILSPIISVIVAKTAMVTESKINLKKYKNPLKKYIAIFIIVVLSASIVTYNLTILISNITNIILPLIIMVFLTEHIKFKNNKNIGVVRNE